ncbi:hypothetical protein [uncultured Dokdonia sp.]|uniref:hypothetical protein n=1 Tax=uncultured Dokdonia sp. TaxID=575653 RepID=UPI0026029BA9|nr:hypothetical protein [uncultured Dokdonia sp.]
MKKLLLLLLLYSYMGFACTCNPVNRKPIFKKFNAFTEIFQGRLIKKEFNTSSHLVNYYLKVEVAYKGVIESEIFVIQTESSAAACGQYIDDESSWIIYATNGYTSACALNINITKLKEKTNFTSIEKTYDEIHKNLLENLSTLKNSNMIVETNKKGDTIAFGKLNINKQPIGCWKYNIRENTHTTTKTEYTEYYDTNGCLIKHPPYKICN